jgi:FAD-linked sulfhydryl oxidase
LKRFHFSSARGDMARRNLAVVATILLLCILYMLWPASTNRRVLDYSKEPIHHVSLSEHTLHGGTVMPKLGNETQKAELGRAAWKLLHTMMARFPDQPTTDESIALESYVHLFARLYPWYVFL